MTRVMLAECSPPFWVDVMRTLNATSGWEPVYWSAHADLGGAVQAAFPHCLFHDSIDAIHGRMPLFDPPLVPRAPESKLLADLGADEHVCLRMMDRMDPGGNSFTFDERSVFYRRLVSKWTAVLDRFTPDLVLFPVSPHVVYDYVILALARLRNIRTLMFERTSLPGQLFVTDKLGAGSASIRSALESIQHGGSSSLELDPRVESYVRRVRGAYDTGMPDYMTKKLVQVGQRRRAAWLPQVKSFDAMREYVSLRRIGGSRPPRTYLKQAGVPMEESAMGVWAFARHRARAASMRRRLMMEYVDLQCTRLPEGPFVFLPLHYQPERTTSPNGGRFVDQRLMVETVSNALPEGWRIAVKEHVLQLTSTSRGDLSRSRGYYRDLRTNPAVDLIPIDVPAFLLMDRAAAVATVTGTAGWEALVRGRPALVFGSAWYADAPGAFVVDGVESCRAALNRISEGVTIADTEIRRFLSAVDKACFDGYVDPYLAELSGVSEAQNVRNLVDALIHHA